MPTFGSSSIAVWTIGEWKSQLLDVSLHQDGTDNWGILKWKEDNTEDSSAAYVKVDILDSSDNVLQSELTGVTNGDYKELNLSTYPNVKGVDIYAKFKLYGLTKSPIIYDIQLT